jgi:hypothetical protein
METNDGLWIANMVAGIAFAINEQFDKILLVKLPSILLQSGLFRLLQTGFMVLYRTAYTLGIEPFFFSHSSDKNAPQTYATVTKYFVIFGSFILLSVIVLPTCSTADDSRQLLLVTMKVVPLIILANFFLGIYTIFRSGIN